MPGKLSKTARLVKQQIYSRIEREERDRAAVAHGAVKRVLDQDAFIATIPTATKGSA